MNDRAKARQRFTVIVGGKAVNNHREEMQRQAELKKFIKACEALYEKNRGTELRR